MPNHRTLHTGREKLSEFLNRRIGFRAKRKFAALNRLPLPNFVCFEPERVWICYVRLAQVLHRNRDAGLAVTRSKRDPLSIDMKAPRLVAEDPHPLDFQVEDVDRERARLRELVSDFVLEPTNQPWGNRSMLFRDPDGNLINFFTPPSRSEREGGLK